MLARRVLPLFLSLFYRSASPCAAHEVGEKAVSRPSDKTAIDAAAAGERSLLVDLLLYRIDRLDLCEEVPGIG